MKVTRTKEITINRSTASIANKNIQELTIEGACCASCVNKIETALKDINGVNSAEMNFALRSVVVNGDVGSAVLINAIERIGYRARTAARS